LFVKRYSRSFYKIKLISVRFNRKFQYLMTKPFQDEMLFGFSNFGYGDLFDFCNFNNPRNF